MSIDKAHNIYIYVYMYIYIYIYIYIYVQSLHISGLFLPLLVINYNHSVQIIVPSAMLSILYKIIVQGLPSPFYNSFITVQDVDLAQFM